MDTAEQDMAPTETGMTIGRSTDYMPERGASDHTTGIRPPTRPQDAFLSADFANVFNGATKMGLWRYDADMRLEYCSTSERFWDEVFRRSGCAQRAKNHCAVSDNPAVIESPLKLVWVVFRDTGAPGRHVYAIGPALTESPDGGVYHDIVQDLALPDASGDEALNGLADVPILDVLRIEEYATLVYYAARSQHIQYGNFDVMTVRAEWDRASASPSSSLQNAPDDSVTSRPRPANGEKGRKDGPNHSLEELKATAVEQIGLCSRSSARQGIDNDIARNMSKGFIEKVTAAQTAEEVDVVSQIMYDNYIQVWHTQQGDCRFSPLINRCLIEISVHQNEPYTLQELAEDIGYSPYYLSKLFKKETGETIADYMQRQEIRHARFLLEHTRTSIRDIASLLGFSPSYFVALFKKQTGATPGRYRASRASYGAESLNVNS